MFALHRYIFSVFGIYHIWSAQIRNIHDLIFQVWDIPILVSTCWRYPWFNLWRLGYPQPALLWLEISMVYLCWVCSKQIHMGYIWDIFAHAAFSSFQCHVTLRALRRLRVSTARLWLSSRSSVRLSSVSATESPTSRGLPLPYGEGNAIWGWSG